MTKTESIDKQATDVLHDLGRFVKAQEATIARAIAELHASRKTSNWMWFVFPQIQGLGQSHMAIRYAIGSMEEARAYLAHPLLGPRLRRCVELLLDSPSSDADEIMGSVDAMKLRSSMTLFDLAEPGGIYAQALAKFYEGVRDLATVKMIGGALD